MTIPDTFIYEPSFVCWVPNPPSEDLEDCDHEHDPRLDCVWGWVCNFDGCRFRTDDVPCPDHAPTEVPELRLVECQTEPRHWIWVHLNDDYGHGCQQCAYDRLRTEIEPLRHVARLREHRWCWFKNRAKQTLIWCRLMHRRGWTNAWGYCSHTNARWRWVK